MQFFKNILLFYNNEFAGVKTEVIRLVKKNQAQLKIIDVFDDFDQYNELLPPSGSIDELKEVIISERQQAIMEHFEAEPEVAGRISFVLKFGNPVVEIIREALRANHDLVIKAATGNKNLKDRLFGNIAVKLLRKCPVPVLILKPSDALSFHKILAPVDPEKPAEASETNNLSENPISKKILDIAVFMARLENSQLDILHCWYLPGETQLSSGRARIETEKIEKMKQMAEKIHTQRVISLAAKFDLSGIEHSVIVQKGDPGHMIIDYAEKNKIDLIVMGTIGRSGLSGLLVGNTAETIIEKANCSVLTLKPEHYKSPINP
jgi:nucleotide-binding universal stress UspA family protein